MIIVEGLKEVENLTKPVILTMGNYDGLHRGHKKIIRKVTARARELNGTSALLTFEPHPRLLLHKDSAPPLLLTRSEKIDILSHWGLDLFIEVAFDEEFAKVKANQFLEMITSIYPIKEIYVGEDFKFGAERKGDKETILNFAKEKNFYAEAISKLKVRGEEVSSTLIRKYIVDGDMEKTHLLLGRPFEIRGVVKKGAKRGQVLGFPTANIEIGNKIVPKNGVYITLVDIGEEYLLKSISNVGLRPTFDDLKKPILEIHLIDRDIDLYSKELRCLFIHKVRDEIKFSSSEELKDEIAKDVRYAVDFLSNYHLLKRKLFWG